MYIVKLRILIEYRVKGTLISFMNKFVYCIHIYNLDCFLFIFLYEPSEYFFFENGNFIDLKRLHQGDTMT